MYGGWQPVDDGQLLTAHCSSCKYATMSTEPIYLDPARTIIEKLGRVGDDDTPAARANRQSSVIGRGIKKAQEITGRDHSLIYRWMYPKDKPHRGRGGIVPHGDAEKILAWARKHKVKLSAEDFFGQTG